MVTESNNSIHDQGGQRMKLVIYRSEYSTLSTFNAKTEVPLSKAPNRASQHKWLPTAPGVCSRCVCVHSCVCVQSTNSEYGSPYLAVCHVTFTLKQMLLTPKHQTRIGTWNVPTLYQLGKTAQLTREMKRLQLAIIGVSETRWTNFGKTARYRRDFPVLRTQRCGREPRNRSWPPTEQGSCSRTCIRKRHHHQIWL